MRIKVLLSASEYRGRISLFMPNLQATTAVVRYYADHADLNRDIIDPIFVHDLFQHEALGIGYEDKDEIVTAFLDWRLPWYDHSWTRGTHPEIIAYKKQCTRKEWSMIVGKARQALYRARLHLRYLDPRAYIPRLHKAILPVLEQGVREDWFWDEKLIQVVVDVDQRKVFAKALDKEEHYAAA